MNRFPRFSDLSLALFLLASALVTGCGESPPSNLSPTAAEDPARYERAKASSEALLQKNREAEQKAMRRIRALEAKP